MAVMRDDFNPDEFYGGPSRSQQRRDALDVLAMAKELALLSEGELSRVPLSESLRAQLEFTRKVTSHVAHKRELQFLAKQLRKAEDELPAIRTALNASKLDKRRAAAALHRIEQWRDRLLGGDDEAVNAALQEFPGLDRQVLRQLIRTAKTEAERHKPPAASRKIFQLLKEIAGQSGAEPDQTNDAADEPAA